MAWTPKTWIKHLRRIGLPLVLAVTLAPLVLAATALAGRNFYLVHRAQSRKVPAPPPLTSKQLIQQVTIPFDTQSVNDSSLASGQTAVKQTGQVGQKTVTYLVSYRGGKEVKRVQLSQTITLAPITQIVAQGTKSSKTATKSSSGFSTPIQIQGDAACISSTTQALSLLKSKASAHYQNAVTYIGIIQCLASGSGIYAYENPPRYVVGDATRNAGTIWYAGTIAHDAGHSRLYHEYLAAHPGQTVPSDVWTGTQAEITCLAAQEDALRQMGAPQSDINYVVSLESDPQYQNIPYADRWW